MSTPPQPRTAASEPKTPSTRPISLVLRVVTAAAIEGRIAGRVEVVDTGESFAVRSAEDLVNLVQRLAHEHENDEDEGDATTVFE